MALKHQTVCATLVSILGMASHNDWRIRLAMLNVLVNVTWGCHRFACPRPFVGTAAGRRWARRRQRAPTQGGLPSFTALLDSGEDEGGSFDSLFDINFNGGEDEDEEMGIADNAETQTNNSRDQSTSRSDMLSSGQAVVQSLISSSTSSRPMEHYAEMLGRALHRTRGDSRGHARRLRSMSADERDAKLFGEIRDQLNHAGTERVVINLVADPVMKVSETAQIVMRRMHDIAGLAANDRSSSSRSEQQRIER